MNANNNTYSCLRTINATHNFLYCEFVTGLVTFYNMKIDPFQQRNRAHTLEPEEKEWLRDSLSEMVRCKGSAQCAISPVKRRKKLDSFNTLLSNGNYYLYYAIQLNVYKIICYIYVDRRSNNDQKIADRTTKRCRYYSAISIAHNIIHIILFYKFILKISVKMQYY